jgi:hypothetical protein
MRAPQTIRLLTMFWVGMVAVHLALFWVVKRQVTSGAPDFRIYYTAALMLRRGEGHVLYDEAAQRRTQVEVAPTAVLGDGPLPYNHPPFEAAAFVPITYLTPTRAYFIWFLVNLLLLAAAVYSLRDWLHTLRSSFPRLWFFSPLAFFAVANALMQGQDSIVLLLVYCLAYGAFRRANHLRAGIYLGLGLFKFHLVLPFVVLLLLARRWRTLLGFFLSAFVDLGVSCLLVGWTQLAEYPHYVLHINRLQSAHIIVPQLMPNLRGLFDGWCSAAPFWADGALFLASASLVLWASRQWNVGELIPVQPWNTGFSVALVTTFLVGYHSYTHDMSIILLPILLTLDRLLQPSPKSDACLQMSVGLLFFSPLYLVLTVQYSHQNLFALILLAFIVCLRASENADNGFDDRALLSNSAGVP